MMDNEKTERISSIIEWMRKNITLSLNGYRPGWENASKFSIGLSLPSPQSDHGVTEPTERCVLAAPSVYVMWADKGSTAYDYNTAL